MKFSQHKVDRHPRAILMQRWFIGTASTFLEDMMVPTNQICTNMIFYFRDGMRFLLSDVVHEQDIALLAQFMITG